MARRKTDQAIDNNNYIKLDNIQAFYNTTIDIIENYCIDNNLSSDDIPPQIWNDIITELCITLYKPNKAFYKVKNNINNEYNLDMLINIYDLIYKRICNKYKKEITLLNFCYMLDISYNNMYNWEKSNKLSSNGLSIYKKIMMDNEQCLEAMMQDKSINPMKVLPILNHKHNWSAQEKAAQVTAVNTAITDTKQAFLSFLDGQKQDQINQNS